MLPLLGRTCRGYGLIVVFAVSVLLVALSVVIHYGALTQLTRFISFGKRRHRRLIVIGVLVDIATHLFEIFLFAVAYFFMTSSGNYGSLQGAFVSGLSDCTYYSMVVYPTLGFGDITPTGDIRFLTGTETVLGAVLIGWTTSFLFLEMQRHWENIKTGK
jgi:hypothetical protein